MKTSTLLILLLGGGAAYYLYTKSRANAAAAANSSNSSNGLLSDLESGLNDLGLGNLSNDIGEATGSSTNTSSQGTVNPTGAAGESDSNGNYFSDAGGSDSDPSMDPEAADGG